MIYRVALKYLFVLATQDDVDLDEVLPIIGEFGRYQKLLLWLVCLPACIPCGFGAFNQLFMSDVPPHWCLEPQLANFTADQRRQIYEQVNLIILFENLWNNI